MINFDVNKYNSQIKDIDYNIEKNSSEFLAHLFQAKVFEFNGETDFNQFPTKIQKIFCKVANLKIGQELLTFFIENPVEKPLSFKISEKNRFSPEEKEISFNLNCFSVWNNKNEEFYHKLSSKIGFVHELLHYKHSIENTEKFKRLSLTCNPMVLLNADFEDGEEQLTICGIDCEQKESEIALCENHFRSAWNLPLRFTHLGIIGPKNIIQKAIQVNPNQFAEWFKSYWKKLPADCYRKEALIVDIAEPTDHQKELISKIESLVTVHNLAKIDPSKTVDLKAWEAFDFKID